MSWLETATKCGELNWFTADGDFFLNSKQSVVLIKNIYAVPTLWYFFVFHFII